MAAQRSPKLQDRVRFPVPLSNSNEINGLAARRGAHKPLKVKEKMVLNTNKNVIILPNPLILLRKMSAHRHQQLSTFSK